MALSTSRFVLARQAMPARFLAAIAAGTLFAASLVGPASAGTIETGEKEPVRTPIGEPTTSAHQSVDEHRTGCEKAGGKFDSGGGASVCVLSSGAMSVCYWPSGNCTYYYPDGTQAREEGKDVPLEDGGALFVK
jgi:hypothetical protein